MSDDGALTELLAKQQIRDAMARYARGIDRRDEALVRSAYHQDSVDSHGFGMDAPGWDLAAMVRPDGNGFPTEWTSTTHMLGQHYIEVDGDTAQSEVYFEYTARLRDPEGTEWRMVNSGRYLDRWVRREGVFRIIKRTVVYDGEVHTEPVRTNWPGPDHEVPKVTWGGQEIPSAGTVWGTSGPDDPSYELLPQAESAGRDVLERNTPVGSRPRWQPEYPLGDDSPLNLVGASGDAVSEST